MSLYTVVLSPAAEEEVREAFRWYADRSSVAANSFRAEVTAAIDELRDSAPQWQVSETGARRYLLKHFPYSIYYDFNSTTVTVLAVAHHRRRPGYWRRR